jgi:hypothetical protein
MGIMWVRSTRCKAKTQTAMQMSKLPCEWAWRFLLVVMVELEPRKYWLQIHHLVWALCISLPPVPNIKPNKITVGGCDVQFTNVVFTNLLARYSPVAPSINPGIGRGLVGQHPDGALHARARCERDESKGLHDIQPFQPFPLRLVKNSWHHPIL